MESFAQIIIFIISYLFYYLCISIQKLTFKYVSLQKLNDLVFSLDKQL